MCKEQIHLHLCMLLITNTIILPHLVPLYVCLMGTSGIDLELTLTSALSMLKSLFKTLFSGFPNPLLRVLQSGHGNISLLLFITASGFLSISYPMVSYPMLCSCHTSKFQPSVSRLITAFLSLRRRFHDLCNPASPTASEAEALKPLPLSTSSM